MKLKFLIVVILSFLAYGNTFNNGFVLDDDVVFLKNRYVQEGVSAIPEILSHGFLYGFNQRNDQSYRPIVLISFAIDKSLFGNDPKILHLLNVLYFSLLSCLLFYLLSLLFNESNAWISLWITLLFVLHPIHTEVVANIKGRDELLHAIFLVLSFIYAIKNFDSKNFKYLVLSLISFFMALLSKEMAITYILLLPLTIWVFRSIQVSSLIKLIIPYFLVLVAYFILRNQILNTITFEDKMSVINNSLAAANSISDRIATNLIIFGNYIRLLFIPHPLSWDYSYPHFEVVGFNNLKAIIILVVTIGLGILSVIGIRSKNKFAFSFLFFVISFSIVSNFFILIGSTLGERFLFFPSVAFCLFIVLAFEWMVKKMKLKNVKLSVGLMVVLISVPYTLKTIERNKEWKSNFSLFRSGVDAVPNSSRAVSALASVYRNRAEAANNQQDAIFNYEIAKKAYQKSVDLFPENTDSWYNLGVVQMNSGFKGEAKNSFQRSIKLDPYHLSARNNLGVIFFKSKNYEAAAEQFRNCLKIDRSFQNAYANLGAVYHNQGEYQKAKENYLKALELNPNDQSSLSNLNKLPDLDN